MDFSALTISEKAGYVELNEQMCGQSMSIIINHLREIKKIVEKYNDTNLASEIDEYMEVCNLLVSKLQEKYGTLVEKMRTYSNKTIRNEMEAAKSLDDLAGDLYSNLGSSNFKI